jgi:hypothetical protein
MAILGEEFLILKDYNVQYFRVILSHHNFRAALTNLVN